MFNGFFFAAVAHRSTEQNAPFCDIPRLTVSIWRHSISWMKLVLIFIARSDTGKWWDNRFGKHIDFAGWMKVLFENGTAAHIQVIQINRVPFCFPFRRWFGGDACYLIIWWSKFDHPSWFVSSISRGLTITRNDMSSHERSYGTCGWIRPCNDYDSTNNPGKNRRHRKKLI